MGCSGGLTSITSGNAMFESMRFNNPTSMLTINGSNGNDTIQISGGDAFFTSSLTVNGGTGMDTMSATGSTLDTTLNGDWDPNTITGGSGNN